jgi:hypothetical protein
VEFPKIETLYERDEATHKLKPELILKNRVYGLIKEFEWTEKIDGMNLRLVWQDGKFSVGGRTDKANIPADLVKYLYEAVTPEMLADCFPPGEDGKPTDAVVYGEGYGAGIQKCGGAYSPVKRFIVFDVLVGNPAMGRVWWLARENVCDVAAKLDMPTVPHIGTYSLELATDIVKAGFASRMPGATCQAEGMVGRPLEPLFDKRGHRLIVKLKTKDFA